MQSKERVKGIVTATADNEQNTVITHTTTPSRPLDIWSAASKACRTCGLTPLDGLQAWTQVVMAHQVLFCTWGFINSFGFFQIYYEETMQLYRQLFWSLDGCWLLQVLFNYRVYIPDCGYLHGFPMLALLASLPDPRYLLWHWRRPPVQSNHNFNCYLFFFSKRRSIALALALAGSSTGGLIFPIMVQQLLPQVGFAWTVRCLGFFVLFCFAVYLSLARTRLPKRPSGALVELSAFQKRPYSPFVVGTFLSLWAVYFSYAYVSLFLSRSLV
ncbi:hypothetical protein BDV29DRAFT_176150 [Aspergillus leporis]|uniref:Major facilitator superfamily domain-containing protein n=1 Tax=Aspergillus leporis TaxID=41062 RepID=A0A5N5WX57_9EURO|nr:hypothetical protein BDV29DRAFT_176150 [Aspergillus leporis]